MNESPSQIGDARLLKHYLEFGEILIKGRVEFERRFYGPFEANASYDDFQVHRTLGKGAFGRVCAVRHVVDKRLYAMKILDKKHIVKQKQVNNVHSEIRMLHALRFNYLVFMEYYFKNNSYLFLVMPLINGGELFTHLQRQKKFDEELVKFYSGQVILAFEYIHHLGIIYRDLKPENILLESDGYIRVTDYGFCKKIDEGRTWTLCGTPEYLAPEIIKMQSYNRSVDWWALGILMFELAAGVTPFYSRDPMKLYDKICMGKFICPAHFSRALKSLVTNIVVVDRTKRFGILKNGAKDVKSHEFFKAFDWEKLYTKKMVPIFKPRVSGAEDMSNFAALPDEPLRVASKEEFPNEFAEIKSGRKNKITR